MTMTDWVEILLKVEKQEKKDLLLMLADDLPEWSAPLVRELANSKYELEPHYFKALDKYAWISHLWSKRDEYNEYYPEFHKSILPLEIFINIRQQEISYSKMFLTKRYAWINFVRAIYDPN